MIFTKQLHKPDILMFDGQGIAHPRGAGFAARMGLWLKRPTVRVAKSQPNCRHAEVGPGRDDRTEVVDRNGGVIGTVLRMREKTNPLFISPGHLMDVEHASEFVLACGAGYRLPESTRWTQKIAGGDIFPGLGKHQPTLF